MSDRPLLTVGQVAHLLGVSVTWVRRLADAGKLGTPQRTPLGTLFDPDAVDAFVVERTKKLNLS